MMRLRAGFGVLCLAGAVSACADDGAEPAGGADGAAVVDAAGDAGGGDAAAGDTGSDDATAEDAGGGDATAGDAGVGDAAAGDAGVGDSGGSDASGTDAGGSDTAGEGDSSKGPSCPPETCTVAVPACLGLVDNGPLDTYGLRMTALDLEKPATLGQGIFGALLAAQVLPPLPSCGVAGDGGFSWLLRFDGTAGTLTLGGAKPVADPTAGYAFVSEAVEGIPVDRVTIDGVAVGAQGDFEATADALVLPVYLNAPQTDDPLLLPLRRVHVAAGEGATPKSCVGAYDAEGLDPADGCLPTEGGPFVPGGTVEAHITLEDADTIPVAALGQSLCVLLSGDPAQFGDGQAPLVKCKRDMNGAIVFEGDWCSPTDAAAMAGCADAVALKAAFAASAVPLAE